MKRTAFRWAYLALAVLVAAVYPAGGGAMAQAVPPDFAITYAWQAGSLPPPYHYSYRITVNADGGGVISMVPGYGMQSPPTWTETFTVAAADRAALYQKLCAATPPPPNDDAVMMVGGSISSLQWVGDGRTTTLTSQVSGADRPSFDALADAARALVPSALWTDLQARRQAFQKGK